MFNRKEHKEGTKGTKFYRKFKTNIFKIKMFLTL